MFNKGEKVALVCCSNGRDRKQQHTITQLAQYLGGLGFDVVMSPLLYAKESVFSGSGKERAEIINGYYQDDRIKAIMDISGGDVANMVLPYLDYEVIARHPKPFWGYSDLTTVINGIYTKTGNPGILYQMMNVVWDESGLQGKRIEDKLCKPYFALPEELALCKPEGSFLQGTSMEGVVVGGNLRCFLKLAGTEYFPDLQAKILLLEGRGGSVAQYATYLAQLEQLGVFEKINGVLLGTFTKMEEEHCVPTVPDLLMELLHHSDRERVRNLPVMKTYEIGHGIDSKLMQIGACYRF